MPYALNTCLQNRTGALAMSLLAGTLPNGLPFGLQPTGERFRDNVLLELVVIGVSPSEVTPR